MTIEPPSALAVPSSAARTRRLFLNTAGVLLLTAGIGATTLAAARLGVDFAQFHLVGSAIRTGENIYADEHFRGLYPERYGFLAPVGMFYPPSTGFVMFGFGLLPYPAAKALWLGLIIVTVVAGVRSVIRHLRPAAPPYVWLITSGIVLMSSVIRWAATPLQAAPIVLGLLCLFVVSLHTGRTRWAFAIAITITAFKITLALPFLGVLVLHRRSGMVASSLLIWVLLNVAGFIRLGPDSFGDFQQQMTLVEGLADINSPDPWYLGSVPRTDWVYLINGLTGQLMMARVLSLILTAAVSLWLLVKILTLKTPATISTTALFLAVFVCLSSLCVYHHQYDLAIFVAPLVLLFFARDPRVSFGAALWMVPLTAMLALLPVATAHHALVGLLGSWAHGWFNMTFPIATTMALVGGMMMTAKTEVTPRSAFAFGFADAAPHVTARTLTGVDAPPASDAIEPEASAARRLERTEG